MASNARAFSATYPAVPIHPERVLVISGQREELVSSGASTTWHDMVLYLVARFAGATDFTLPAGPRQPVCRRGIRGRLPGRSLSGSRYAGKNQCRLAAQCLGSGDIGFRPVADDHV